MSRAEDTLTAEGERMSPWPAQIAIIGAGTMGLGIAEQFALAGRRVRLTDATADLARLAKQKLLARVAGHVAAGLLPEEAIARLDAVEALDDIPATVAGAEFILEAVPEDRAAKAAVLALCAEHAPREAVIASNTSSFPIDGLAAFVSEPTRFLGTHWFNPPEWTPGVEVIAHAGTAPDVVARVLAFLSEVGKLPVLVGNGPGFVANRIQNALFLEAVRCVEEGLASPQEVDAIVRSTFGFRLPFFGPFQIADMAGLDLRPVPDRRYGRARSSARSRSPIWPGSIPMRGCSRRYSTSWASASSSPTCSASNWRRGGSGRRAARASPTTPPSSATNCTWIATVIMPHWRRSSSGSRQRPPPGLRRAPRRCDTVAPLVERAARRVMRPRFSSWEPVRFAADILLNQRTGSAFKHQGHKKGRGSSSLSLCAMMPTAGFEPATKGL